MREELAMFVKFFKCRDVFELFSWRYHGNMKGDDAQAVKNRETVHSKRLPDSVEKVVRAGQINGNQVAIASLSSPDVIPGVDGLVSKDRHIALEITFADCLPLFFVDSTTPAIGIVHAGYKGIAGNIISRALNQFRVLGTETKNLKVGIGPSICKRCYEFSTKDADIFGAYRDEFVKSNGISGKCTVNLQGIAKRQLTLGGILEENILDCGICTVCGKSNYFSARGREDKSQPPEANLGIIGIKGIE